MKPKIAALVGLTSVVAFSQARAEITAGEFLRMLDSGREKGSYVTYLRGVSDGIGSYNSLLDSMSSDVKNSTHKMYCPPEHVAFTSDQEIQMLRLYVRRHAESEVQPIGMVMLLTFVDALPCK
jgi:hypothetical protein